MDTRKMRRLPKMSTAKSYELLEIGHEIGWIAARLSELLEDTCCGNSLLKS
jgi:hypothetical protein